MSEPQKSELKIDLDVIMAQLTRSKKTADLLANVVDDIKALAEQTAQSAAKDSGDYAKEFLTRVLTAEKLRSQANLKTESGRGERGPGVARRRRGQRNKHRYLDTFIIINGTYNLKNRMVDPDFKVYNGLVGFIGNYDWKAVWIEYGTLAMPPRMILTNAAEQVAQKYGAQFEIMYEPKRSENRGELSKRIKAALARRKAYLQKVKEREAAEREAASGGGSE
jgi:hypothetical protein